MLEDRSDISPPLLSFRLAAGMDQLAVDQHGAPCGFFYAENDPRSRCLAGSRLTNDAERFSAGNIKRDVVYGSDACALLCGMREHFRQVSYRKDRFSRQASPPCCASPFFPPDDRRPAGLPRQWAQEQEAQFRRLLPHMDRHAAGTDSPQSPH